MPVSKADRLREFLRRLGAAGPAGTAEEALALIEATLTGVEDELTDTPADPDKWMTDGRMYAPQGDSRRAVVGNDHVTRFRSRAHNTFIATNGALEICTIDGVVLLRKPGTDGRHVWDL
jgi:hypothetical protein